MTLLISVIVPVYDDWDKVGALLERLSKQSLSADRFEVVLVDNGSRHKPPAPELPGRARVVCCAAPGSYAARNHGAAQARGQWLAFTDADCLPAADWLLELGKVLAQDTAGNTLFAGAIDMVGASERPGPYEIYDLVKGIPQERYVRYGYGATANLALPRALFQTVGGFDARRFSGGDAEFCRRAGRSGYATVFCPQVRVGHPPRRSRREVVTKIKRIKGGQLRAGSPGHRRIHAIRTLLPPLRGMWFFLRARRQPLRFRLVATLVLIEIWFIEIAEMIRLAFGGPAERR